MTRKRLTKLSILAGFVLGGIYALVYVVGTAFLLFPPDSCHRQELKGKTNQEIADFFEYPLVILSELPPGLRTDPHIELYLDRPDPRCFMKIRYGIDEENSPHLSISVVTSMNERADSDWECHKEPYNIESSCAKTIVYSRKFYDVVLNAPFSVQETQDLTRFLTIATR